jgi:prepilin-type N-terminal cleavage/methylation domain-containing protein
MQIIQGHLPQRRPNRWNEGYTLVEVLCAIMIAATSASVLFVGFDNGFCLLRTTREDLRATQILMQKTEAFRLYTWQQLTNAQQTTGGTFQEYYFPQGASTNKGTLYVGTLKLLDTPTFSSYSSGLHLITITLNWTNLVGKNLVPHSRAMQTLSAKYGMEGYLFGSP